MDGEGEERGGENERVGICAMMTGMFLFTALLGVTRPRPSPRTYPPRGALASSVVSAQYRRPAHDLHSSRCKSITRDIMLLR